MRKLSFEEITRQRPSISELQGYPRLPLWVMLDDIRSLYNVGAIFRTSDAARIEKLLLCGITGHPPRKEIDKTALGAVQSVPWEYHEGGLATVKKIKNKGIPIAVLEHTDNSIPYREVEYPFPLCVVLGNEVDGVSDKIVREAELAIEIPMFGTKQSLNVSVAFGILVYEILFQYLKTSKNPEVQNGFISKYSAAPEK